MKAYLTIGIPGCGKSTYANTLAATEINLDNCREAVNGDQGDQRNIAEVIAYRDELILKAAEQQQDIVISDTNIQPQFRTELVSDLRYLGYEVIYVVFNTSVETALQQNLMREKVVPEHVIYRMHDQLVNNPVQETEADQVIFI
jgi:predicted kinase